MAVSVALVRQEEGRELHVFYVSRALIDAVTRYLDTEKIDLALVVISNNAREFGLNLLNKAKNSMIDNFHSIKWLFHELEEIKERMG